jgi:hypothetical protein
MTRPDGPDNQEFDDLMLPPLDALYGSVATPLTDDMLDHMLTVAFDPMTPDPGIDLPSFDIDLNDFADDAHHNDMYDGEFGADDSDHDDLSDFFDTPDDGDLGTGHLDDGHLGDGHIDEGHELHDFGDYDGDMHNEGHDDALHDSADHGFADHGFADGVDDDLLGGM